MTSADRCVGRCRETRCVLTQPSLERCANALPHPQLADGASNIHRRHGVDIDRPCDVERSVRNTQQRHEGEPLLFMSPTDAVHMIEHTFEV